MGINNPLATNMYLAPIVAVSLFIAFLIEEGFGDLIHAHQFSDPSSAAFLILAIIGGGLIAFLMVNLEFALIATTSVVTFSVAGIVKEVTTIMAAIVVFGDKLTGNMVLGLIISLCGIAYYNYLRITQSSSKLPVKEEGYEELDLYNFEVDHLLDEELFELEHLDLFDSETGAKI